MYNTKKGVEISAYLLFYLVQKSNGIRVPNNLTKERPKITVHFCNRFEINDIQFSFRDRM